MTGIPQVEGVNHRTVRARGLDFHVAEAGSGEDVVLCLHGWPQHWYEWRHLMPALADRHRVLAMDLRGFGWSDAPPDGYEKENLADDVLAVLDQLGVERVKLVGHDWGGWIGFLLCLKAPRALRAIPGAQHPPPVAERRRCRPPLRLALHLPAGDHDAGDRLRAAPATTFRPPRAGRGLDQERGLGPGDDRRLHRQPGPARAGPGRRADVPRLPASGARCRSFAVSTRTHA